MKIAQVCHRYPPNRGGIEKHVKEISERLAREHDVEVICADLSSGTHYNKEIKGVKIKRFKSIAPNDAYFIAPQISSYLRKSDFDIIHAHNYHAFPALFASSAKKDRKFIFTPHYHGIGSTPLRDKLNRPYKLLGAKIFNRADKIICVSEFEKELIKRNFKVSEDKMTVIPNGIDIGEIKEAEPFDFDGNLILYVGRLEKYKNIHLVIKAMKFLPESYFYIGGTGNYEKELRNLIRKFGLRDKVKLLGFVSEEEKYRWMKTCSLFVNLSSIEAFGMTVLEALAAGKPVIVNEEGGLRELAEKFDYVVPVHLSGDSFLEEVLRAMSEARSKEVNVDLEAYKWERVVERILDVYLGVMDYPSRL